MAEQAVNTIYALGDHPDTLCNELIKGLARKAFGGQALGGKQDPTRPSTPDAMETDTVSGGEQDGDVEESYLSVSKAMLWDSTRQTYPRLQRHFRHRWKHLGSRILGSRVARSAS